MTQPYPSSVVWDRSWVRDWSGFHPVSLDTEYDPRTGEPYSLQWSTQPGTGNMVFADDAQKVANLKYLLEHPESLVVMHNLKADLPVLWRLGIYPDPLRIFDTMCGLYILGERQGLKTAAWRNCGFRMRDYSEVVRPAQITMTLEWVLQALEVEWPDPDPVPVWSKDPQKEKLKVDLWVSCTKRKQGGVVCMGCGGAKGNKSCVGGCNGTGYRFKETKTVGERIVPGTESGHWRIKHPQNVGRTLDRLLKICLNEPDADDPETDYAELANPLETWSNVEDEKRLPVEKLLGPIPRAHLAHVPIEEAVAYGCADADGTLRLFHALWPRIAKLNLFDVLQVDCAIIPLLLEMETNGMRIDPEHFARLSAQYGARMEDLELQMQVALDDFTPPRPGSRDWVASVLYDRLDLPCTNFSKKTGLPSTDADALFLLKGLHPFVDILDEWRLCDKFKGTYIDALPKRMDKHDRIHGTIKNTRTTTGRLSMAAPSLMNLPAQGDDATEFLKGFIPADGNVFIKADYAAIELRGMALESGDEGLLGSFERGEDPHANKAVEIWGDRGVTLETVREKDPDTGIPYRSQVKPINFGVPYGLSAPGLATMLHISEEAAQGVIDAWYSATPRMRGWTAEQHRFVQMHGYIRETILGRIRFVPHAKAASKRIVSAALREAGNHPIQSWAQAVIKIAMAICVVDPFYRDYGAFPTLQIHDALMFECPKENAEVFGLHLQAVMEGAVTAAIPILVDVAQGLSWGDCK